MSAVENLKTWVGREQHREATIDVFPARALAAALDHSHLPSAGEFLPPSWHWLYFLDPTSSAGTGSDGHAKRGDFLPPVSLPRRMWAGGAVHVVKPLRLAAQAERRARISAIDSKSGKTGALVFVKLEYEVHQDGQLCIREDQTLVYRDMPTEVTPLPDGERAPESADWSTTFAPDPIFLFRYSALTYNAHRIHYDREYATRQEFYPGLVVHGPLLATLLLDLALRRNPGVSVSKFNFRAVRPTFDLGPVKLSGRRTGCEVSLWSSTADNYVGMHVMATLVEGP